MFATLETEKSETTKAYIRQANAVEMKKNCAATAGRANAIQAASPRCAPISGTKPCTSASASARIKA